MSIGKLPGGDTMIRRLLAGITVIALLGLCGCSRKEPADKTDGYPVETDVTLRIWVSENPYQLNNSPFAKAYQEMTGIGVKFEGKVNEADPVDFRLLCAAGQPPDIICADLSEVVDKMKIGQYQEYFVFSDKQMLEQSPHYMAALQMYFGEDFKGDFERRQLLRYRWLGGAQTSGLVVRGDTLEKLGIEIPETIAEWETMLMRLQTEGAVSEPLLLQYKDLTRHFAGAYGVALEWYLEDGVVKYGYLEPGSRDFFADMHRWYENHYIGQDLIGINDTYIALKMEQDNAAAAVAKDADWIEERMYCGKERGWSEYELIGVKDPVLHKGELPIQPVGEAFRLPRGALITKGSQHKELAIRLLDWGYTAEGSAFLSGVGQTLEVGDTALLSSEKLLRFGNAQVFPFLQKPDAAPPPQYRYPCQADAVVQWETVSRRLEDLPLYLCTDAEREIFDQKMSEITPFVEETGMQFVLGERPIEEFEQFQQRLFEMGVVQLRDMLQSAYARYQNRIQGGF